MPPDVLKDKSNTNLDNVTVGFYKSLVNADGLKVFYRGLIWSSNVDQSNYSEIMGPRVV